MLLSAKRLRGAEIHASDGRIGALDDLYFDDAQWRVRYLVIDTGGWLSERKVLVTPAAATAFDRTRNRFEVAMSRDQVANSPGIDTDKPVSRQYEVQLHDYYGWAPYWGQGLISGAPPSAPARAAARPGAADVRERIPREPGDPHLRSMRAVSGHSIHATDGDIGHVRDFLIDRDGWTIRYMVVDTRNWLPGRDVLISPQWIEAMDWLGETVRVDLTRQQVKDSPPFDPSQTVERGYEDRLFSFYGRAPYW